MKKDEERVLSLILRQNELQEEIDTLNLQIKKEIKELKCRHNFTDQAWIARYIAYDNGSSDSDERWCPKAGTKHTHGGYYETYCLVCKLTVTKKKRKRT